MFVRLFYKNLIKGPNQHRIFSSSNFAVKDVTQLVEVPKQTVSIKGWIRSVRTHKNHVFVDVDDGSTVQYLQVVVPSSLYSSEASFGSCVEIHGVLEKRNSVEQPVELKASKLNVIGSCDGTSFPIKSKQRHSMEYLRSLPHLKFRTKTFQSLMRIRSAATHSVHSFFKKLCLSSCQSVPRLHKRREKEEKFCHIHVPILTTNDCEGAGEVFHVEPFFKSPTMATERTTPLPPSSSTQKEQDEKGFFGVPTFLTVSGQLHLEVVAGSIPKVYCFGPTFRAENSHTRHHLSEFSMVEAEISFADSLEDITTVIENLIKKVSSDVIAECKNDVDFFMKNVAQPNHLDKIERIISNKFHCITYTDAIEILKKSNSRFKNKAFWGIDLHKEHEQFLVESFDSIPIFVTDYPVSIKPFYAKANEDGKTVSSVDLLFPDVGEICGGSLRECNLELLEERFKRLSLHSLDWYLDLRRFGSCPHGGFGLGFDRFIQVLLGLENIRDTLPFPRTANNCKL